MAELEGGAIPTGVRAANLVQPKKGIIMAKKQNFQQKKEFLNMNNLNIRIPEAQKKRHKKTARRHCLMLSGMQLIQLSYSDSSPTAIMHAMQYMQCAVTSA